MFSTAADDGNANKPKTAYFTSEGECGSEVGVQRELARREML